MIHCPPDQLYRPKYVALWMLLSLKAGYLNAAGFLSTGKFVSHVTGFGTQIGVSLTHRDYFFGAELLFVPISFILGASVPAWILDRDYDAKRLPEYYRVQLLITFFLGVLWLLGLADGFGSFERSADDLREIFLLAMLCFVCGMKNGLSTWATFGKIRTTHLTGLATDMGLHLPKIFRDTRRGRFPEHPGVNVARLATFLSFSLGSLLAAAFFPRVGYAGFVIPFGVSVLLSVLSVVNHAHHKRRLSSKSTAPAT